MKRLIAGVLAVFMAAASVSLVSYGVEEESELLAFPGAEGGGKYSQGARANDTIEIYHVTNLDDYNPLTETAVQGSLRDALSQPGRIVVFDTDGAVHLTSTLTIPGNTAILGQTAPGEGITLTGYDVLAESGASDIILRYIRVRPTDDNGGEPDGLGVRRNNNVIFGHCSVSWSVDKAITLYAGTSEDDYSYGPSARSAIRNRIYDFSNSNYDASTHPAKADYYFFGNYVYGYSAVTADNSQGINNSSAANLVDTEFDMGEYALTTDETAQEAYSEILENAGATETRTFTVDESRKTEKGLSGYADNEIITEGEFAGYVLLEAWKPM